MNIENIIVKLDRHIELVTTDTTGMKETGFGSVGTCQKIFDVLNCRYTEVRFNEVKSLRDLDRIVERAPDLVVLCVKYIADEKLGTDIWLSEYFAEHDILYTGSDRATLEFDSDKSKAKRLLLENGVATAKFFRASPGLYMSEEDLPFPLPLFIKPLDAANGNGVDENSLAHDFESFQKKVAEIFTIYGHPALVEEVLPGREFTVAVLNDVARDCCLASPAEIVAPKNIKGDRVLGSVEKSSNQEAFLKVTDPALTAVVALAKEAFSILGVRDFGRIDVKMDAFGLPHFIEANLVPGLTPESSYFPRACDLNRTMPYESVVLKIVDLALTRTAVPAAVPKKLVDMDEQFDSIGLTVGTA